MLTHAVLRTIRAEQGITEVELARRSGVTERTIRSLELGQHPAALPTLMRLGDALGVRDFDALIDAEQ